MIKGKYLNPFTDYGFKRLFGTVKSKEFLISFLNSILDLDDEITDIQYENVEKLGITPQDRNALFDLYCTTASGEHIIVEMQNARQQYFKDRSVFYATFPIAASALSGEWDFRLPPVYFVAFLNFNMADYIKDPDFKHVAQIMDIKTKEPFYDKLTFVYLEMPKFTKDIKELESISDKWLYVINNMTFLEEYPQDIKEEIFQRFFKTAEISALRRQERFAYESSLKHMRDYNNTVNYARKEGYDEGMEKGIEMGIEKGKLELRIDMAKSLLKKGMPIDAVAELVSLSPDQINQALGS